MKFSLKIRISNNTLDASFEDFINFESFLVDEVDFSRSSSITAGFHLI
jgi:hypothetical protein